MQLLRSGRQRITSTVDGPIILIACSFKHENGRGRRYPFCHSPIGSFPHLWLQRAWDCRILQIRIRREQVFWEVKKQSVSNVYCAFHATLERRRASSSSSLREEIPPAKGWVAPPRVFAGTTGAFLLFPNRGGDSSPCTHVTIPANWKRKNPFVHPGPAPREGGGDHWNDCIILSHKGYL
jgi:hypothetical protein